MHITCEHCGSLIDIKKDKTCPKCGAPYTKSAEYKEMKEYSKKEREVNIESKELVNKMIKNSMDNGKKVFYFAFGFILFVIVMVIIFSMNFSSKVEDVTNENGTNSELKDIIEEKIKDKINEDGTKTNKEINVSFKELAKSDNFEIKCSKVSEYKYDYFEKKEFKNSDLKVYNFEIVLKNKNDFYISSSDIKLTYTDKEGNENVVAKKHNANVDESKKQLDLVINDNLTHKGNISFEIPKYVKDVKIVFKNVNISIDKFKNKM